jgi:hypothetical protein
VDDDQDRLLSRRRLLQTGAIAFAGVTLLDTAAFGATRGAPLLTSLPVFATIGYDRSRFSRHVGTAVVVTPAGGAPLRMQLAGVDDVANVSGLAGAKDAYTLRFSGPASPALPAGIVSVRHPGFGTVALYVTPGQADATQRFYVAAINRRIPAGARRAARAAGRA